MDLKPPLKISDQINLLESRGLVINEKEAASSFLKHHNSVLAGLPSAQPVLWVPREAFDRRSPTSKADGLKPCFAGTSAHA